MIGKPPGPHPPAPRRSLLDQPVPGQPAQMKRVQARAPAQLSCSVSGRDHAIAADQLQQSLADPMPLQARIRRLDPPSPTVACRDTEWVESMRSALAQYFDGWYADMTASSVKDEIHQRHLGLPPGLLSNSALTWQGIAEVTEALHLSPRATLLDLACGRGCYGLEIAGRTDARLVGVDFSAEAIHQARQQARRLGRAAAFHVGDLAAPGLGAGSAGAVLCVDAIQFAPRPDAAYGELRRVLAPGGRVVLTCWEPVNPDERVPDRLRRVSLHAGLAAAGFSEIKVRERPSWRAAERSMWEEAAALDPGDDPSLQSFHNEGVRSLDTFTLLRRVMATATA